MRCTGDGSGDAGAEASFQEALSKKMRLNQRKKGGRG